MQAMLQICTAEVSRLPDYMLKRADYQQFLQNDDSGMTLGGNAITDVHDTYLWRWNEFKNHDTGEEQVQLQSVQTGMWMSVDTKGKITCDKKDVSGWETFTFNKFNNSASGDVQVQLQAVGNGRYLGGNCDGCKPILQCQESKASGWETFDLINAFSEPAGEWVAIGTASSSDDSYTFTVEYSEQLQKSTTTSLSDSFEMSVEESFTFEGIGGEKASYSDTVSASVSDTVSQTLSQKRGETYTHKCPATVCDGQKLVKIYQWKMSANLQNGHQDPLSVMTVGTAVFAWSPPKCPWTVCDDVQCQTCKNVAKMTSLV